MTTRDRRVKRAVRIKIDQQAHLVTSDGHVYAATLKDVSRDGFRIQHDGIDLLVGEIVTVRTGRSHTRAQLQWVTEGEAGATFV